MQLVDDWKIILRKAWSLRLALLAAVLGALEMVLPMFSDVVPRNVFLALSTVTTVAAAVARLVAQPKSIGGDQ